VPLDDLATDRQPDARALELAAAVQALKHLEDSVDVLFIETDPIVLDRDTTSGDPLLVRFAEGNRGLFTGNLDDRRRARLVEFYRIHDQVLKQLPHLGGIGRHRG
jgi:hypothetical protein